MSTTVSKAARWTALACLSLWLCACGAADRLPTPPDQPATAETQPQVYYAGEDGLPLYPQPARSGSPLTYLPLNEKLLRSKVEQGFASVTVARTGQTGWVENAKLIWKKAEPPTPAPVLPAEVSPAPVAPAAAVPPAKSTSPATEASGNNQPGSKPDASIFDAK